MHFTPIMLGKKKKSLPKIKKRKSKTEDYREDQVISQINKKIKLQRQQYSSTSHRCRQLSSIAKEH